MTKNDKIKESNKKAQTKLIIAFVIVILYFLIAHFTIQPLLNILFGEEVTKQYIMPLTYIFLPVLLVIYGSILLGIEIINNSKLELEDFDEKDYFKNKDNKNFYELTAKEDKLLNKEFNKTEFYKKGTRIIVVVSLICFGLIIGAFIFEITAASIPDILGFTKDEVKEISKDIETFTDRLFIGFIIFIIGALIKYRYNFKRWLKLKKKIDY